MWGHLCFMSPSFTWVGRFRQAYPEFFQASPRRLAGERSNRWRVHDFSACQLGRRERKLRKAFHPGHEQIQWRIVKALKLSTGFDLLFGDHLRTKAFPDRVSKTPLESWCRPPHRSPPHKPWSQAPHPEPCRSQKSLSGNQSDSGQPLFPTASSITEPTTAPMMVSLSSL